MILEINKLLLLHLIGFLYYFTYIKFKFTFWVHYIKLSNFLIMISFIHSQHCGSLNSVFLLLILHLIFVSEKYLRFQILLMTLHRVMEHRGCDSSEQKKKTFDKIFKTNHFLSSVCEIVVSGTCKTGLQLI